MAYRDSSSEGQGGLAGMMTIKPDCGLRLYSPVWSGHVMFRPIGPLMADGTPEPHRLSSDRMDFGSWISGPPGLLVRAAGVNQQFTFLTHMPGTDASTDLSPYQVLFNSIKKCKQSHPEWYVYTIGEKDKGAALPRASGCCFIQGVLLQHGDRNYYNEPMGNVVLCLHGTARSALENLLDAEIPGFLGDPGDWRNRFGIAETKPDPNNPSSTIVVNTPWGDILDLQNGKLIQVIGAKGSEDEQAPAQINFSSGPKNTNNQRNGGDFQQRSYEVKLQPCPPIPASWYSCFKPWDRVVNFLDPQRQVNLLAQAYPGDMLMYGLKDTRFFAMIPDHVKQGRQVNVGTTQKNTGTTAPASGPAFGAFGALNTGQGQAQSKPAAPSQGTTVGVPVQGTTTVPAVHQPGQSTSGEPVAGSTTVTVAAPAGTTPVGLDPAAMNSTLDQLRKTAASINGGNQGQ